MDEHKPFMLRAIELAAKARGYTSPNPMVGCVVVKDGQVVGEGYHEKCGADHAEVNALKAAGDKARGAALYVTLEPCSHDTPEKKKSPCAPKLIEAGIRSVFVAMVDPNPLVEGKGNQILRDAGIEVEVGLCESEARQLNSGYISLFERGRPFVTAKWAMSLDGKIATASGDSKWITSEAARNRGHVERGANDAVMVGIGTVLADDPELTNRSGVGGNPLRIVVDPHLELPPASKLVQSASEVPLLVLCADPPPSEPYLALQKLGVEIAGLQINPSSYFSWNDILQLLASRKVASLFVEGGSALITSAFEQQAVDRVMAFVAPKIVGGKEAMTPVAGEGVSQINQAMRIENLRVESVEPDVMIFGDVRYD